MKIDSTVQVLYFEWLCEKIRMKKHRHLLLAEALYKTDFYWTIDLDINRCKDGIRLREDFGAETGNNHENLNDPCNLLEVMVALMFRFDDLMPEATSEKEMKNRPSQWFWEMVNNAGLYKYTDEYYMVRDNRLELNRDLERILSREYDSGGFGGFFPLENPEKDQRKVEIWYQMNAYIMEKAYN